MSNGEFKIGGKPLDEVDLDALEEAYRKSFKYVAALRDAIQRRKNAEREAPAANTARAAA